MLEDFSSNSKGKRTYAYTILFLELKTLNVCNSNSCRDVAVLSAGGTTFGTSFELDSSLLCRGRNSERHAYCIDEKLLKAWFLRYSLFLGNQTLSPSFLGLKDVPALKLRVPALTSRVCSHSYWDLSFRFLGNSYLLYGFVSVCYLIGWNLSTQKNFRIPSDVLLWGTVFVVTQLLLDAGQFLDFGNGSWFLVCYHLRAFVFLKEGISLVNLAGKEHVVMDIVRISGQPFLHYCEFRLAQYHAVVPVSTAFPYHLSICCLKSVSFIPQLSYSRLCCALLIIDFLHIPVLDQRHVTEFGVNAS
ncbi:hypothetical protein Tco_0573630 [Tanacetum coccineum]